MQGPGSEHDRPQQTDAPSQGITRRDGAARHRSPERRRRPSPLKHVPASFSRTRRAAHGPGRGRTAAVNVLVMTFAAGMVTTMALPAYATTPKDLPGSPARSTQELAVPADVAQASVARDTLSATSVADLNAKQARVRQAVQARNARLQAAGHTRAVAGAAKTYSGPSAADYLKNPPYPNFSLASVFQVAQKYIGTPYVFGGATPAGFDCSGLVMYVYAQFGIAMPHSATAQGAMGTRISLADAVPGDLIVMPGHIGFYAGGNKILDAPDSGRHVAIRPIWTSNFYVVRIGIK